VGDSERFYVLVRWFVSIGVCWFCALDGAIAMVERESGREWKQAPGPKCDRTDRHGRTCRTLAELHWSDRPARSEMKGAA